MMAIKWCVYAGENGPLITTLHADKERAILKYIELIYPDLSYRDAMDEYLNDIEKHGFTVEEYRGPPD